MNDFVQCVEDDKGAITIDWVALTAGVILLGAMVVYDIFNDGVGSQASNVNSNPDRTGFIAEAGTIDNMKQQIGAGTRGRSPGARTLGGEKPLCSSVPPAVQTPPSCRL